MEDGACPGRLLSVARSSRSGSSCLSCGGAIGDTVGDAGGNVRGDDASTGPLFFFIALQQTSAATVEKMKSGAKGGALIMHAAVVRPWSSHCNFAWPEHAGLRRATLGNHKRQNSMSQTRSEVCLCDVYDVGRVLPFVSIASAGELATLL